VLALISSNCVNLVRVVLALISSNCVNLVRVVLAADG
jgi:hypothetical protein